MEIQKLPENYIKANEALLEFNAPLSSLLKPYDHLPLGEVFDGSTTLRKEHVIHAINKYLNKEISKKDLIDWVFNVQMEETIMTEDEYLCTISDVNNFFMLDCEVFDVTDEQIIAQLNDLKNAKPETE